METLGPYLRQQREKRDISLETVASCTRIQAGFLEAIETDRLDQIPHAVSTQGFIRSYVQFLGLDPSETFKRFFPTVSPHAAPLKTAEAYKESLEHLGSIRNVAPTRRTSFSHLMKTALKTIGVISLLILFIAWLSHQNRVLSPTPTDSTIISQERSPADSSAPFIKEDAPRTSPTLPLPVQTVSIEPTPLIPEKATLHALEVPRLSPTLSSFKETVPSKKMLPDILLEKKPFVPPAENPAPPMASPLTLLLEADALTWVKVVIDDRTMKDVLLQPGDKVRWDATQKFLLTVGNAGGVRAFLDGQNLGILGRPDEVLRDRLITRIALEPPQAEKVIKKEEEKKEDL